MHTNVVHAIVARAYGLHACVGALLTHTQSAYPNFYSSIRKKSLKTKHDQQL
jgi:hypothetical protein